MTDDRTIETLAFDGEPEPGEPWHRFRVSPEIMEQYSTDWSPPVRFRFEYRDGDWWDLVIERV